MSKVKPRKQSIFKECSFCKKVDCPEEYPPLKGKKAIGSYWCTNTDDCGRYDKVMPFRGYVCDMHHDEISWKKFRWGWEKR